MKLAPENINYGEREREREREREMESVSKKATAGDYFSFNYHQSFPLGECRLSERSNEIGIDKET